MHKFYAAIYDVGKWLPPPIGIDESRAYLLRVSTQDAQSDARSVRNLTIKQLGTDGHCLRIAHRPQFYLLEDGAKGYLNQILNAFGAGMMADISNKQFAEAAFAARDRRTVDTIIEAEGFIRD